MSNLTFPIYSIGQLTSRRKFLSTLGMTASSAVALGAASCSTASPAVATTGSSAVIDSLNFALNLEFLEASFYSYVATGAGISAASAGAGAGMVTGGSKVTFVNAPVASIATQLATDELDHVVFLTTAISNLGGTPISMPSINLAAMGAVTSDATFLALARELEAVGTSAYLGAAVSLASNSDAVTWAAQILALEGQHEAYLRMLCILYGISSPAVDAQDTPPSLSAILDASATTGLNPVRTPSQVLQILYGAPGQTGISMGGFFPNGVNGNIKST